MRKNITAIIMILYILPFLICSCGGNTSKVEVIPCKSDIYTYEAIDEAIETTKELFEKEFKLCKLLEIQYVGDLKKDEFDEFAKNSKKEEVIILKSDFHVNSYGADASLKPDYTYKNWNWILGRNKGEKWEHLGDGY